MKPLIYTILAIFIFISCDKKETVQPDYTYYKLPDNKTITITLVNMNKNFANIAGGVYEGNKWHFFNDTTFFYPQKYTIGYGESITFKTHYLRYKICFDVNKTGTAHIDKVSGWIGSTMTKYIITDDIILNAENE